MLKYRCSNCGKQFMKQAHRYAETLQGVVLRCPVCQTFF